MESNKTKSYLWGAIKIETKPVAATKKDKGVIAQLAKEFVDRSRADIQKWRQAIQAAENPEEPKWSLLQDLYDNLLTDGHLSAVINIRKAATLSNRFYIKDKSDQEQDEKTALLNTEWFYNMLEHLLDAVVRGYTVMELTDPTIYQWMLLPRRNIIPQKHMVMFEANGDKGIVYTDPGFIKNIVELRSMNFFGILNTVVPQLIWKRNAQQTWADFAERFGIPMISAETLTTDKKELDRIENMLRNLGQAAMAVLPQGTTVTIHDQATKGDPHKVFSEQINTTNDEISKAFLGGTMVIDNGSSRSQSEVHERTLDYKIAESDRRMIEFFVNGKLIPLLRLWGFGFADGDVFVFDRSEELDLTSHWNIINQALLHYEIPEDWISDRFGFPIDAKKQNTQQPGTSNQKPETNSKFTANFR